MPRVHEDELEIDEALVRALLAEQFPEWAALPLARVEPDGTVNVIYRLGGSLSVRLPRREGPEIEDDLEFRWLPFLAPQLPVEIPSPVARGAPGAGYPWYWSIHTWLDGELPTAPLDADDVAGLVAALQRIDASGGPDPSGGRGRPLEWRDRFVRDALERVEAPGALELWDRAMRAPEWTGARVWIHADLDRRNVLVRDGRLTGVLDWGGLGLGDPAVDVMVAWKLVAREERDRFRALLDVDDATWLRAQGWVVSQALIALGYYTPETNPALFAEATRWLMEVIDG
jgi:aminoglycoside phosphotransferase (APT) family kinase protein